MAAPPKSGSGAFIAAALLMLLVMGGLIFWKLRGGSEEKPIATPPPPPPQAPMLEEPPPPPPPPEEVVDSGTKTTVIKKVGASGGCAGECTGKEPAGLRSALAAKAGQARGCYERALRQNATLSGRLAVSVRIGPGGAVCSANVAQNGLGDPGVASCVVAMFRGASFPAPEGGCVDAQVPMNFVPKGGGK